MLGLGYWGFGEDLLNRLFFHNQWRWWGSGFGFFGIAFRVDLAQGVGFLGMEVVAVVVGRWWDWFWGPGGAQTATHFMDLDCENSKQGMSEWLMVATRG